ncbi:unnamed protein product [Ranitomeya imitator]|uniref:Ig-like domain-containing protein n=1 Tax=Ranitomeya imitator TaxID=111125 RepID=A0ABN9LMJ5_9NEOB|nr:unnamed protein product [Ranitomeya imitator]
MRSMIFHLSLGLIIICLCRAVEVTQNPKSLIVHAGIMVTLSCVHDDTSGSYNMYWYQQRAGQGLTLMAMTVGVSTPTVEKEFEKKWIMTKQDAKESLLKKDKAEVEDSAVYFCASSITATENQVTTSTKTWRVHQSKGAHTQTYQ